MGVPSLAWVVLVFFVATGVLPVAAGVLASVLFMTGVLASDLPVCAAVVAGCAIGVAVGAVFGCAKAPTGRIARPVARSRLEMRVIVGFLCTGGIVGWSRLRRIKAPDCDVTAIQARRKYGKRCVIGLNIGHLRRTAER